MGKFEWINAADFLKAPHKNMLILKKRKQFFSMASLLPLAACGGGGGSAPAPQQPQTPTPTPTPDFTESPTGTFTGSGDGDLTLDEGSSSLDVTVTSGGGNDIITTGGGNDTVDAGGGDNTVDVGEGNNTINVGHGDNLLNGGNGDNYVFAGEGANTITLGDGNNYILTLGDGTVIQLGNGDNVVSTGNGDDFITAGRGNNVINTGPGNDRIRVDHGNNGNNGNTVVVPGGGADDVVYDSTNTTDPHSTTTVIIGDTSGGGPTYTNDDINDPMGTGINLADVLTLDYLNNHPVSDVEIGEILDGGTSDSTLLLFGDVDLSGITVLNMDNINFDYRLSLTPEQIAQFLAINGDGSSVLTIIGDPDSDTLMLDITKLTFSDISTLLYSGSLEVTMSEISQLPGIGEFVIGEEFKLVLEDDGSGANIITLSDLEAAFNAVDAIDVGALVTMFIDDPASLAGFDFSQLGGEGTVLLSDLAASTALLFDGIVFDDDIIILNEAGEAISAADLGAIVVADIEPSDIGVLPEISIDSVSVFEAAEVATFTVSLNARFYDDVTVDYVAPDGTQGTLTFVAGELTQTFTTAWTDDDLHEANEYQIATLSNPTNGAITDGSGQLVIANDDLKPSLAVENVTVNEGDGTVSYTIALSGATSGAVTFDWATSDMTALAGTHYTASSETGVIIAAGETSTTITVPLLDNSSNNGNLIFNVTLSNISNTFTSENLSAVTMILDNDSVELIDLDGSNGFALDGINFADHSGSSVSNLGDINNDGYDDFIIAARDADPNGLNQAGQSYVVYGGENIDGSDGSLDLAALDGTNGFAINGVASGDLSGYSLSGAGDINNDGYNDIIIGASQADPNGNSTAGTSYVIYGGSNINGGASVIELSALDGSNGFVINGIDAADQSGYSVSSAGDFNNDGYDDLLISALSATAGGDALAGESYIIYGSSNIDGSDGTFDLSSLDGSNGFVLAGIDADDKSGRTVASVGDLNGDGYDDIIISASDGDPNSVNNAGETYVVYGGASVDDSDGYFDLSGLDGSNGFTITGIDENDVSGFSVSSAGDLNGDGVNDLIIGAWAADANGNLTAGESYVVYGGINMDGGDGILDLSSLDGSNGFVLNGIDADDQSGRAVSSAGDVNGDGYDDIIIGAASADANGSQSGESYIVFGGENIDGSDGVFELASLDGSNGYIINGIDINDMAGVSVSAAGDVNNDGYDDLLIGADGADVNGTLAAGQSYIIYGSATSPDDALRTVPWGENLRSISVDQVLSGNISSVNDNDWYEIQLVAGNTYFFSIEGSASGGGTLSDPRLVGLVDVDGQRLPNAYDDNGAGNGSDSAMMFTATESATYYIAVDGNDSHTGTYRITVADMTDDLTGDLPYGPTNPYTIVNFNTNIPLTSDIRIDALLSQARLSVESSDDPTVVTYSFPNSDSSWSYTGEPDSGFAALTAAQQDAFRAIVESVEVSVNFDFVEIMDTDYSAGAIRIAWTGDTNGSALAWAYYPSNASPISSDIWLSSGNLSASDGSAAGSQSYFVMMHELGHALGLKHSFEGSVTLPAEVDGREYTVMSYDGSVYIEGSISADLYPQSFMYYDYLALNYLYGTAETGDNSYVFDGDQRYYMTIWDLDGNDTIEFTNQTQGITINLSAGQWLDVGTNITYQSGSGEFYQNQTVYLPIDSMIENLYGTGHDDTITGNSADNNLRGMSGADIISAAGGADTLDGGTGADLLTGGAGADIFVTRAGDGGVSLADADMVLDFTDGEDMIGLNGYSYDDLTITDGTGDNVGDTIIQDTSTGEYLMVIDGVAALNISADDFTAVQDEWWLA